MDNQQNFYGEINLVNYIKLLKKRKKLIFSVFALFIIGAVVYVFFINPKTYKAEAVLQIGTVVEMRQGNRVIIEDPLQVIQKIKNGVYGDYSGVKASKPEGTELVTIEVTHKNVQETEKTLKDLVNNILADHNSKINNEKQIALKEYEEYNKAINDINKDISSFIVRGQQIGDLRLKIYDYNLIKGNIENQLDGFRNTSIIKETVSDKPISPKPLFDITMAGILGVLCGISLAFIKEWWEKNKQEINL